MAEGTKELVILVLGGIILLFAYGIGEYKRRK